MIGQQSKKGIKKRLKKNAEKESKNDFIESIEDEIKERFVKVKETFMFKKIIPTLKN